MRQRYKTEREKNINKELTYILHEVATMKIDFNLSLPDLTERKKNIINSIIHLKKYIKGEIDTL